MTTPRAIMPLAHDDAPWISVDELQTINDDILPKIRLAWIGVSANQWSSVAMLRCGVTSYVRLYHSTRPVIACTRMPCGIGRDTDDYVDIPVACLNYKTELALRLVLLISGVGANILLRDTHIEYPVFDQFSQALARRGGLRSLSLVCSRSNDDVPYPDALVKLVSCDSLHYLAVHHMNHSARYLPSLFVGRWLRHLRLDVCEDFTPADLEPLVVHPTLRSLEISCSSDASLYGHGTPVSICDFVICLIERNVTLRQLCATIGDPTPEHVVRLVRAIRDGTMLEYLVLNHCMPAATAALVTPNSCANPRLIYVCIRSTIPAHDWCIDHTVAHIGPLVCSTMPYHRPHIYGDATRAAALTLARLCTLGDEDTVCALAHLPAELLHYLMDSVYLQTEYAQVDRTKLVFCGDVY